MKRMMSPRVRISFSTFFRRSSKSPRYLLPATSALAEALGLDNYELSPIVVESRTLALLLVDRATAAVDPLEDVHADAEFRRDLVRAVARRALERAAA